MVAHRVVAGIGHVLVIYLTNRGEGREYCMASGLEPCYLERGGRCLAQGSTWHVVNLFLYCPSRIGKELTWVIGTRAKPREQSTGKCLVSQRPLPRYYLRGR